MLAGHERNGLGMPTLPLAIISHPLGDQPPDAVEDRAELVIEGLLRALTTPAERLMAEERERQYPEPRSIFRSKPIFA